MIYFCGLQDNLRRGDPNQLCLKRSHWPTRANTREPAGFGNPLVMSVLKPFEDNGPYVVLAASNSLYNADTSKIEHY